MNEPRYHQLLETAWRRKLTATEETELRAWLAVHPEMRADWEAEAALSEQLVRLPDAPLPSNFTARVLQAVERESVAARRSESKWPWLWRSLVPKVAIAALFLLVGSFTYQKSVAHRQRQLEQKAQSVVAVAEVSALPDPATLQDFEAIRQLSAKPAVDPGLMAVFSYLQ
jgi:anti-sigma factor RsiW